MAHIVPAYGAGEANIAIVQRMELAGRPSQGEVQNGGNLHKE
jgi:hypothetical protein